MRELKELLLKKLVNTEVSIYLFGSRANGTARATSDVDIGLDAKNQIDPLLFSDIVEAVEYSTIPYKVDIVDMTKVSPKFYDEIIKTGVKWKDYNKN